MSLRAVLRTRLHSLNLRHYPRSLSSSTSTSTSTSTSSTTSADFSSSAASSWPSDPPLPKPTPQILPRVLKAGFLASLAASLTGLGFASYAYTADEVDEKTKAFRSSINQSATDTVSKIDNHQLSSLYTAVMTVPAKTVDAYLNARRTIEERVQEIAEPTSDKLLPDMESTHQQMGVLTLVLDLRETLIHNEWKRETGWATFKRPGLDAFLQHLSQFYEIVVYTDELYVDNVMEKLMQKGVHFYLSRPATKYQDGKHYRDLTKLNRKPSKIIYVSGHALDTCLQHENCVTIKPWRKEADDTTLIDLIPFLEFVGLNRPEDIRPVLASYQGKDIASEFILRSKEHQRVMQKKRQVFPWRQV